MNQWLSWQRALAYLIVLGACTACGAVAKPRSPSPAHTAPTAQTVSSEKNTSHVKPRQLCEELRERSAPDGQDDRWVRVYPATKLKGAAEQAATDSENFARWSGSPAEQTSMREHAVELADVLRRRATIYHAASSAVQERNEVLYVDARVRADALQLRYAQALRAAQEACRSIDGASPAQSKDPPKAGRDVSGKLPKEAIQRVIRQSFGVIRECYEAGLARNPKLTGRIAMRFVISRDGGVDHLGVASHPSPKTPAELEDLQFLIHTNGGLPASRDGHPAMADLQVVQCVENVFRLLKFPKPEGGIVTVLYPIVFSPG